ncbi:MAG: hypothetical protein ACREQV_08420 [Candidatus Binatia bacterium]
MRESQELDAQRTPKIAVEPRGVSYAAWTVNPALSALSVAQADYFGNALRLPVRHGPAVLAAGCGRRPP